jgi:CheY-like chemotaxis protein
VVEDHNDARRYLELFLGQLGAKVMVARNAFEGLEAIKNTHPALVVSDIKMSGMDGFELLNEIRSLGPDARGSVPVIAMSAFSSQTDRTAHASRRFSGMPAEAIHSRQISGNNFRYSLSHYYKAYPRSENALRPSSELQASKDSE